MQMEQRHVFGAQNVTFSTRSLGDSVCSDFHALRRFIVRARAGQLPGNGEY